MEFYIANLRNAAHGKDKVALTVTQEKGRYPHWYVVEEVLGSGNACEVVVRDAMGIGKMGCREFARIANGLSFWIPTPNLAIVWFEHQRNPPRPQRYGPHYF